MGTMRIINKVSFIKNVSGGGENTHNPDIKYIGGGITNPTVRVIDNVSSANTNVTVSPYVDVNPSKPIQGGGRDSRRALKFLKAIMLTCTY